MFRWFLLLLLPQLFLLSTTVSGWRPWPRHFANSSTALGLGASKKYEGSSEFVHLRYHMGPVLTANITVHPIWYGTWLPSQKHTIRSFLCSIFARRPKAPSVSAWWSTVRLYTDQTGVNIFATVRLGAEKTDRFYSHGRSLTRLSIESVIRRHVSSITRPLPINPHGGVYLLLTSPDVQSRTSAARSVASTTSPSPPSSATHSPMPGSETPPPSAPTSAPTPSPSPSTALASSWPSLPTTISAWTG